MASTVDPDKMGNGRGMGRLALVANLSILALLVWLFEPLLHHRSITPAILSRYSVGYAIYLTAWFVFLIAFAILCVTAAPRMNQTIAITVVLIFVCAELYLRVAGPGGYAGEDAARWPRPYVTFAGKPGARFASPERMGGTGSDRDVVLNRLGFRGDVPVMPKANETRVIVLGSSAAFNGAPLAKSIPGWIERLARESGRSNVRVYNWAVTSYVSGQELALLVATVTDFEPDLVIAYDGANDASVPYIYDPRPGYPFNWLVYEQGYRSMSNAPIAWEPAIARTLLRSRVFSTVFREQLTAKAAAIGSLRDEAHYGSTAWSAEIVAGYAANLQKMCGVAAAWDFRFVAALQPVLFVKHPLVGSEPAMLLEPPLQRHMTTTYARFREEFKRLDVDATRGGRCQYIDVSNALDGTPTQLFWDYVHVNNDGNEIVARRLFSELVARRLL
jgi:hypothetical protein